MVISVVWTRRAGVALGIAVLVAVGVTAILRSGSTGAPDNKSDTIHVVADETDPAPQVRRGQITVTPGRTREPDSTPAGRLVDAAWRGRLGEVEDLLREGVAPVVRDINGDLPLHQAARAAAPEVVRALLAAGADPNESDSDGWFPLSYAVLAGCSGCTELLLQAGAAVRSQTLGGSPLEPLISGWLAAEAGIPDAPGKREGERVEVARIVLEAGGVSGSAEMLFGAVAIMKNENLVALLLEHGARLDTSTSFGSALMRLQGPIGDRLRNAARQDSPSPGEPQA